MRIDSSELSHTEYFGLDASVLETMRRHDEVLVLWTRMPGTDCRLALMLAPVAYAWGMQFRHRRELYLAIDGKYGDDVMAQSMQRAFELLGIDLNKIPVTLMCGGQFGGEYRAEVGQHTADIPRASFRSELLPDDDQEFQLFIERIAAYIGQLGRFFLSRIPADVNVSRWAETEDKRLTRLFDRPQRGRLQGENMDGLLQDIRQAVQSLDEAEAGTWLTPRFLEWEPVRPQYPIPAVPRDTWLVRWFFNVMNLRPMSELVAQKKERTMLLLQLMKKWRWPLGLRVLHNAQTSKELRKTMLGKSVAWEPAELLVSEVLAEGRRLYPVLFE